MSSEWKMCCLQDVLTKKGYIRGPFGSALRRGELLADGFMPVYEQQNAITENRTFRYYIDEEKYESLRRFTLESGDIIISCSGTVGFCSLITEEDPKGIISQALLILRPNIIMIEPLFLLYYLRSRQGKAAITSRSSGSVQVNIAKREVIEKIPLLVPVLSIQRAIAATLSCLDDKIELNNKICANLEAQAQALFKSWFVDFEPFQNGNFVESELGLIPEGWSICGLTDIASFTNGLAMQKHRPTSNEEGIPVLKIKELRQKCCDNSSDLCTATLSEEYLVNDGDIVFSWSGTLLVDVWTGGLCGLNQHLFKITSSVHQKWFYYLWTKFYVRRFAAIAKDKATTMGHIRRKDLEEALVLVPDNKTIHVASELLNPILEAQINLRVQNQTLAALRDALLPKLMSGEIEVPVLPEDEVGD